MQKRAVDLWLKGGRKNKAKALREAGYSRSVYRQPNKVFKSPVVQDYLDKGGFGRDGLQDNCKPESKPVAIVREPVKIPELTLEQRQKLKEQLGYTSELSTDRIEVGRTTLISQSQI